MAAPFEWSLAALETLMAEDQMDQHAAVLRAFSVVELWRLRRVCRAFHRWGTVALAALPRVVAVGGTVVLGGTLAGDRATAAVEVLDLSTLRWSSAVVPALPEPRNAHALCSFANQDGRVVVAGGDGFNGEGQTALQWVRGATNWAPLPNISQGRCNMPAAALPDGRAMVIGGYDWDGVERTLASVEVLAADGSGWSALRPMNTKRTDPSTAVLPCGKVLVAGGYDRDDNLETAELWDPTTGAWTDLPPMEHERYQTGCCVLPSGRVAVVGGHSGAYRHPDGEVFDPVARTWQALPPMKHARTSHGVVAVAGGLLAVGGTWDNSPNEVFDEASGLWFELPHPMAQPRRDTAAVSLPATALAPAPAAAAQG
eukprot:COSAG04_NODE_1030_length_8649_cov_4.685263_2_plen_370_part_00